jgi:hypothetical protein
MVPICVEPPTVPFTLQVTVVFDEFETVAANCWLWSVTTAALVGVIATEMGGESMVTAADALFEGSAELIADTATELGFGTDDGAV